MRPVVLTGAGCHVKFYGVNYFLNLRLQRQMPSLIRCILRLGSSLLSLAQLWVSLRSPGLLLLSTLP
jgi:hypothetical protein